MGSAAAVVVRAERLGCLRAGDDVPFMRPPVIMLSNRSPNPDSLIQATANVGPHLPSLGFIRTPALGRMRSHWLSSSPIRAVPEPTHRRGRVRMFDTVPLHSIVGRRNSQGAITEPCAI